ncbi:MAG: C_GCAxxG_C_C family protein [Clostridia bacterium]|nr:C_GCAxxG_C_C family protein [Clostridia bacterium]
MSKGELAKKYFEEGYSCSQAIVLAFADCINVEKSILLKLSSSFGGGFGRLREVCGAFSGMSMVVGYVFGYDKDDGQNKMAHYALVRELAEKFKQKNGGSVVCRELIAGTEKLSAENPSVRTDEYKHKRPCSEIVKNAGEVLQELLLEKGYSK